MTDPRLRTQELFVRVRAGDAAAVEELLRRYRPRLANWVHGRLPAAARGAQDTQDIVQGSLVRSLRHLATFEPRHEGSFIAYLIMTAHHLMRDAARDAKRRPMGEPLEEQLPDPGPTPGDQYPAWRQAERVQAAMQQLSAKDRKVIELRFAFELSYDEMAAILGATPNAARMQVERAIGRLALVLGSA